MNDAPLTRGPMRAITITPETNTRLFALVPFARGLAPHGWHLDADDERLVAAVLGYKLQLDKLPKGAVMTEVISEFFDRVALAAEASEFHQLVSTADETPTLRRTRYRMRRMAPDRSLFCGSLEVGTLDRLTRRARRVERLWHGLTSSDSAVRRQKAQRATDEELVDLVFASYCTAPDITRPFTDLVEPVWVIEEIRSRIERPDLESEMSHVDENSNEPLWTENSLTASVDRMLGVSGVESYRAAHNLGAQHPFWTDDRIRAALDLGMT